MTNLLNKCNLLECTLRDGGYITNWFFQDKTIRDIINTLVNANLDFVEVGYLNARPYEPNFSIFNNIEQISDFLPESRRKSTILAMADVQQFFPENVTSFTGKSIDGIRVVFYKHQIQAAIELSKAIRNMGYKLFIQPMVTIDYSIDEYAQLIQDLSILDPYAVSIVDSFGYMTKQDVRRYFKILDNILSPETLIGFHSHNNLNLALITAQDILEYNTARRLIIDSSLCGLGRGAGNLQTELIANYYNSTFGKKYNIDSLIDLISEYIMPLSELHKWGYSPYYYLTALYRCHPNYAAYLIFNHNISVSEFKRFIQTVPEEMKTICRKPYVEELYNKFCSLV